MEESCWLVLGQVLYFLWLYWMIVYGYDFPVDSHL